MGCWYNKYWIDQIYNAVIVAPCSSFHAICYGGPLIAESSTAAAALAAGSVRGLGALVQRVQSGNIRSYAGWLAVGAGALLLITYFGFSMHL